MQWAACLQASVLNCFPNIRTSYLRLLYSMHFCEQLQAASLQVFRLLMELICENIDN